MSDNAEWYWEYNKEKNELEFWADGIKYMRVLEIHGDAYAVGLRNSPFTKGEQMFLRRSGLTFWHERRWEQEPRIKVDQGMVKRAGERYQEIIEEIHHADID